MSNEIKPDSEKTQPMIYQIRIRGHLGREWTDWFEGLTITVLDNSETLLTCPVADQAALYGLLRKVRYVGMLLLSVVGMKPGEVVALGVKHEMNNRIKANLEETHESTTRVQDRVL